MSSATSERVRFYYCLGQAVSLAKASHFQEGFKPMLAKHSYTHVTNYFDNIVVHSETFFDHLKHLHVALSTFISECVRLNCS